MAGIFEFLGIREKASAQVPEVMPVPVETRSIEGVSQPEKVFIERDGPKGVEWSYDEPFMNDLLYGHYGTQNLITLCECLPELASAVDQIAKRVSSAKWRLKYEKNDEEDYSSKVYEAFNRLFEQPNPLTNGQQLIYQAVRYYLVTGKAYFFFNSGSFDTSILNVINWNIIPSNKCTMHLRKNVDVFTITTLDELIANYTMPQNGKTRVFDADKVLPILRLSLKDGINPNCPSPVFKGAEMAIANLVAVYEARGVIYIHKGPLGLLVSNKPQDGAGESSLSKREVIETQKELQRTYGLRRGQFQVGLLSTPISYVKVAADIKDLMPWDETETACVEVFAAASIPRHLAPTRNQSTYANAASDMTDFYSNVIVSLAEMLAKAFTTMLKLGDSIDIRNRRYIQPDFSHVPFLQDDKKKSAETDQINGNVWEKRFLNGVCSLNDWIVGTGNKKKAGAIYTKTILDMTPDEQALVTALYNIKSPVQAAINSQEDDDSGNDPATGNA